MAKKIFIKAYARPMPSTPPVNAITRFSIKNCPKIRRRDAPIDARTAISFRRAVPRASNRLPTFTHAMSRTKPTTPCSSFNSIGTLGARKSFFSGSTRTPQPLFDFGWASAMRRAMASNSVFACAIVTPGFSCPNTTSQ